MGLLSDPGSMLQQYHGASASAPPDSTVQDFKQIAPQISHQTMAGGLSDVFRSNQTPPFGQMVGQMFGNSNGGQRAGILNQLLGAVGGAGALSGLASMFGNRTSVTPEEANQVSPQQVQDLATHAEKQDPSIIDQASDFYARHPTLVQGLGAGALALMMSRMSQRS